MESLAVVLEGQLCRETNLPRTYADLEVANAGPSGIIIAR